eukprot:5178032-Prymnesium_polylepis.1
MLRSRARATCAISPPLTPPHPPLPSRQPRPLLQLQNDDKSWSKTSADLYGVDARAAQDTSLLMGQTAYN